MKLDFEETPNYNKLRFLLTRALLDVGRVPNREYDWIPDNLSVSSYKKGKSSHKSSKLNP